MASNKNLPIIAGGIAALFFLMGGKAKASTSQKSAQDSASEVPPTDTPNGNIPHEEPKPNKPNTKPVNVGPINEAEIENISRAIEQFDDQSAPEDIIPSPYNMRAQGQSVLDWKTNLAFWLTYSWNKGWWVAFENKDPLPYKLSKTMKKVDGKGYEYWSKVWLRIRNYIKEHYQEAL